jgi:hypothetical protein
MKARLAASLLLALTLPLVACDGGEPDGDPSSETHADTHADHGADTSDADTMIHWHEEPPATATVEEAFDVMFMVHTEGEVHVREVRVCEGADVPDCGLGEMDTFTSLTAMHNEDTGMDMASFILDTAGDYTVVAYAHVGADPHISDAVNVTAE